MSNPAQGHRTFPTRCGGKIEFQLNSVDHPSIEINL